MMTPRNTLKTTKRCGRPLEILLAVLLSISLFVLGAVAVGDWFTDKEPVEDYAFSFAFVGDTQVITLNHSTKLGKIYDWILENRESKKIAHVFGLGDITNDNTDIEWKRAVKQFEKMDGVIPYSLIRGNHDKSNSFEKYVCTEAYLSQFDGFYRDVHTNSYRLFSVSGVDFLFITLDFGPSDRVLSWAEELIAAHPDRKVIITTHAYLHKDGTTLDYKDGPAPTKLQDAQGTVNNGDNMWDKVFSKYENVFLIVSGHVGSDDVIVTQTEGEHGNVVTQLLIDSQTLDKTTPSGMVVMLYFSNDGQTISIEQYSTIQQSFYRRESQREITVPVFFSKEEETTEAPIEETTENPVEETTTLPNETTASPETGSETTPSPAPAESGCKSSIGGISVTMILPILCCVFFKREVKKRDD